LPDEANQFAVLQAGTGEAGQQMVAQGHKLEIGGDSMIGKCVASGQAGIALDVGQEAQRFDNPLLPNTRSEMALPLRSRGRAVGAMTVQSSQAAAFSETDIAVMQTMANQVAVAIDNAQLFAETEAALNEIEATQRHYLGKAWTEFAGTQAISGYEQIKGEMVALGSEVLPQVQRVTRIQSGSSAEGELSSATLTVPLEVRGQPIGALGFQDPEGKRQWSPEEITLVEEIARQLAQAADNLRLVEETQRRAAREQMIGEIAANMRETLDIETMLKTAAQEIGAALGLAALDVRLGTEPAGAAPPFLKTE
jgi:GAF domain-containing protein